MKIATLVVILAIGASAAAEAQFRSTLTFRTAVTAPAPVLPRTGALHGVLFPWGWVTPVIDLNGPVAPIPLPDVTPLGGVQLDMLPWRAQVFLDGAFVGRVDDFKGYYHHLDAAAGPHQIVIVEPGYQPLVFEVVVSPGRTMTLRGALSEALRP